MPRCSRSIRFAAAAAVAGLAALAAWSAPILPGVRLSDEIRSLARADRVELVIMPLPEALEAARFEPEEIRRKWETILDEAGIALGEGGGIPKLRLSVITVTDESLPDGIAYLIFFTYEQTVHVPRLEQDMFLPTWTGLRVGMHAEEKLREGFRAALQASMDQFLARRRLATISGQ